MRCCGRRGPAPFLIPLIAVVLPLGLSGAGPGGAGRAGQAPARAKEPSLQHEVTVTLKLIQVFVTNAKGKPVLDLEKSDFVVTDNGKPQTVTDFERHLLTLPAAEPAGNPPAAAPIVSPKAAAPLLSRRFFFIIDYARNDLEGVQKARNAVLEFLDKAVLPGDEVSLYTLSSLGGLTLHVYRTTDQNELRRRLGKLRETPGITPTGDETSADHELMGMELMSADIFGRHGGHGGTGSRNHFAEIAAWAKSLRAFPGQKSVILFTRGFGGAVIRPGDSANTLFQLMARELATANASVFTINTTTGVQDKIALGVFPEPSLDYLSRTTGGTYFPDVNYYTRIASDIQDATANYYVLGYTVPAAWDGKYHEVKVEVTRPGCVVHAQRGYFNPVPFGKLTPLEKHLHLLEVALGEGAPAGRTATFPVAGQPFPRGGGTDTLLIAEFPGDLRALLGDRIEFVSLVLNEGQAIVDGKRWEVDPKDLQAARTIQYSVAALAPGRYDFRAVLRNLDDGRAAAGAGTIEVPALLQGEPAMFPPLFLVRGREARYLSVSSEKQRQGPAGFSIFEAFPFPAGEYVPLVGELAAGATSLWADLVCVWKAERGGEKDLSARLLREGSGDEIPVSVELLSASSREDRDVYLLGLEFPALAPGAYRLEVRAEDRSAEQAVAAAGRFSVRQP